MAKRVAISNLNARTIDILNTIRANASYEYQQSVPEVTSEIDIPKVGEILYGYPALANQFINSLVNRIALVRVKSATFNNAYAELKKGYLEFGETVEEVFVGICKAREFSAEKGEQRELKRSLPDVRTAFHTMNWRVQYPITIQDEDLRQAFLSANGVQDLIAKIVDAVYTASEYDEYLLFKYLMIKAIAHGKMYPVVVDASDAKNLAKKFRGTSNQLTFMSNKYNASGVTTTTPKADQFIFMDSDLNAEYDVDVLAGAFNMDKADFIGKLKLIDDWTTFDNARFSEITANCDMVEQVTSAELALMADVKAVICDKEWFQVYDNANKMTEKYVASGMYWNYFYNVWKTVSSSPFSNAIVFVDDSATTTLPDDITVEVLGKTVGEGGTILTMDIAEDEPGLTGLEARFVQSQATVTAGIAVHKYGAIVYPPNASAVKLQFMVNDTLYESDNTVGIGTNVGAEINFSKTTPGPTPSADATLSALSVDYQTLSPTFAPNTTAYTIADMSYPNSIKVNATANASGAVITAKMNGQTATIGQYAPVQVGQNVYQITVTNGDAVKVYTITFNAVDLTLSSVTAQGVTFTPSFDPDVSEYTGTASAGSVTFVGTPTVTGKTVMYQLGAEGEPSESGTMTLVSGENIVNIWAQDDEIGGMPYTFTITAS